MREASSLETRELPGERAAVNACAIRASKLGGGTPGFAVGSGFPTASAAARITFCPLLAGLNFTSQISPTLVSSSEDFKVTASQINERNRKLPSLESRCLLGLFCCNQY